MDNYLEVDLSQVANFLAMVLSTDFFQAIDLDCLDEVAARTSEPVVV